MNDVESARLSKRYFSRALFLPCAHSSVRSFSRPSTRLFRASSLCVPSFVCALLFCSRRNLLSSRMCSRRGEIGRVERKIMEEIERLKREPAAATSTATTPAALSTPTPPSYGSIVYVTLDSIEFGSLPKGGQVELTIDGRVLACLNFPTVDGMFEGITGSIPPIVVLGKPLVVEFRKEGVVVGEFKVGEEGRLEVQLRGGGRISGFVRSGFPKQVSSLEGQLDGSVMIYIWYSGSGTTTSGHQGWPSGSTYMRLAGPATSAICVSPRGL